MYRPMLLGLWLLNLGGCTSPAVNSHQAVFAAYGDMPYSYLEQQWLQQDISTAIRRHQRLGLVINVGDLGRPALSCDPAWLLETRRLWQRWRVPVFYTPGDNDWADCDRASLPQPVSQLQRLSELRRTMFVERSLAVPADWHYRQQPGYPEHQRWQYQGIGFVSLHLIGGNNGRAEVLLDNPQQVAQQAQQRERAALRWLQQAIEQAKADSLVLVLVIAMQVDLLGDGFSGVQSCLQQPAFRAICQQLLQLPDTLSVLLLHGDSMPYCLDRPLPHPQFWRLNLPGDYRFSDVVEIAVQPGSPQPFRVRGLLTGDTPARRCD